MALVEADIALSRPKESQDEGADSQSYHIVLSSTSLPKRLIASSPYTDEAHLLDLDRLELPSRALALALQSMEATSESYATTPYLEAFNWPAVFQRVQQETLNESTAAEKNLWDWSFYVVVFRSIISPTVDRDLMFLLDKESHREASESGGLLKYWYGSPNAESRNLATCLWRSAEDAREGGKGPLHRMARAEAKNFYKTITFETWKLDVKRAGEEWSLEKIS
ncbi:hypothetical protein P152DRAFT_461520 [Eremomyces bilateralis CBS 781.70]|uniref:Uncharacterized protein n=1 Tax=Eremomyces bilateralis CBS 781.70 TaxID=1392243 RepID=A0A6G1FUF1_9PEZI|nr:uncharacterized protein P152DRAFT_461520 [Eremomyces bilateralis CBS 781.70]KAF1809336.1 hypothetical protein P152DRAFT_461520 [Eremomyces bilateralis CBS 781.70]